MTNRKNLIVMLAILMLIASTTVRYVDKLIVSDDAIFNSTLTVTGNVTFSAGQTVNVTTVDGATYDLLVTDYILNVTYTATDTVAIDLKTAQTTAGRILVVKDAGGNANTNNITITTEESETIDGEATFVMDADDESINLYSDGTNWFIY